MTSSTHHHRRSILGIDLGTTYSLAAVLRDGRPAVLDDVLGTGLTASAVSIDPRGEVLVGSAAAERLTTYPEQTAVAFKRDMGTDRVFDLGGRRFTPQELSALVLRRLKEDAERSLGTPIERAVITVPAYFDQLQRKATQEAAEIAGLEVERLLNEPTAAALAYGLHERDRELRAIVLDLGGGTFDVTVLEIIEGVIEIQASAGDTRLGGEDFVDALAERVVAELPEDQGRALRQSAVAWSRLRQALERAKRRLSSAEEARIALPALPLADGSTLDLERTLSRVEAEDAWRPLLERLESPVRRALADAGLRRDDIDEVLLVGGASRTPCFVRLAASLFGRMPQRDLPPDEAVAQGAAIQAALVEGHQDVEDLVVTDIAPFTLGIAIVAHSEEIDWLGNPAIDDVFSPILERGTVIPCSRVRHFSTVQRNQRMINVRLFQGEHSRCSRNRFLGEYKIRGIPSGEAGEQEIAVRLTYDLSGLLEVESTVLATGKTKSMVIERIPGQMSAKEIRAARQKMSQLKIHPAELLPNANALERAEALFQELRRGEREYLGSAIASFRATLEGQDPEAISEARGALLELVGQLRPEV